MALYIDADLSGTGGSGTSGDPYKSWTDFRIANATRDLVTEATGELEVFIKGLLDDPDSGGVRYTLGCTTNSSNYYHFKPWPGYESNIFSSMPGFYSTTTGSGSSLILLDNYHKLTHLRCHMDGTGSNEGISGLTGQVIDSCWVKSKNTGILPTTSVKVRNCIVEILGVGNGIRASAPSASGIEIDFNTVIANGNSAATGIDPRSTSAIVRNNVVYVINSGTWTNEYVTNPSASSGNNAGQLTSASQPTNVQTNYVQLSSDPFEDSTNSDWRPTIGSDLDGAGIAITGLTVDLSGVTRASPPDIGALESISEIESGTVVLSTYNLTVSQQSGSVSIPIDVGSIAYTTYDLTVAFDQNHNRFPDQGELTLSTYAESLSFGVGIPTSVDPAESFPDDSAMGITGYAPVVNQKYFLPMSVGATTFTTYAPTADVVSAGIYIDIGVGTISYTGYAPDDINAHVPSPSTGTITFTSYIPTIDVTHVRAIDVGSITTTTYSPSISADTNTAIPMDVGAATYTGYAPSLSFGIGRHPDTGSITFTSYTPDAISEDVSWEFFPDEGSATYSTYDLTLSIIEVNKSIPIAVGSLVIPGWKPPFGSNPSVEVGARKRRKILGFLK